MPTKIDSPSIDTQSEIFLDQPKPHVNVALVSLHTAPAWINYSLFILYRKTIHSLFFTLINNKKVH